jgi:hypothetical protein
VVKHGNMPFFDELSSFCALRFGFDEEDCACQRNDIHTLFATIYAIFERGACLECCSLGDTQAAAFYFLGSIEPSRPISFFLRGSEYWPNYTSISSSICPITKAIPKNQ